MPIYERDAASIYYEDSGEDLPAILLIAPGGMKSAIGFWENTPWDPREHLRGQFRVIAMDQRNAGRSTAPVSAQDGWHTYTADHVGLMNHLGVQRFHVAGMCIGGPYCLGLIEAVPDRVVSATLFQSIGRDNNRDAFYAMFDDWASALEPKMPDVSLQAWSSFRGNMVGDDNVLFNVDEAFVAACTTPLLVLMGNDLYHPQSTSRMLAETAPNVTFVESWKEGRARDTAMEQCLKFLRENN
ncbi:MAG: pimeloyl-ACP methyl ester carboxylesterase [Gammaproteobacteria bacterium]|jgi:pimeloyl-ACP methyl ester carboxylesterase